MKLEQSFEVTAPIERVWDALIDVERVAPCLPGASVTGRNEDGSYAGALTIKIGPTTAAYAGRLEMEQIDEASHSATMQAQGTDKRGQGGAKATISSKLTQTPSGTRVDVVTDYHITGRLARFGRGGMIEDISARLLREFAGSLQKSLDREPAPAPAAPAAAAGAPPAEAPVAPTPAAPEPPAAADGAATPEAGGNGAGAPATEAPAASAGPAPSTAAETPPPPPESNAIEGIPLVSAVVWERVKRNPAPAVALIIGFLLAIITLRRRGRD